MLALNNHGEGEGGVMNTQHITYHEAILDMLDNVEHPHPVILGHKPSEYGDTIDWLAVCRQCDGRRFGKIVLPKPAEPEGYMPTDAGPQSLLDWVTNAELNDDNLNGIAWSSMRKRHGQRGDLLLYDDMPEGLVKYIEGEFMRYADKAVAHSANEKDLWIKQIDSVMTAHGKSEMVFRGISHIPDGTDGNLFTAGTWYTDPHYVSTSSSMEIPMFFASTPIGLVKTGAGGLGQALNMEIDKTIMQIEITPNVKTIACEGEMCEIIIEHGAVFEIQRVWQGLHMMHAPLYQFVQMRVHPPGKLHLTPTNLEQKHRE